MAEQEADRALDKLIAEKVMGKKLLAECDGEQYTGFDESYWYCSKCRYEGNWSDSKAHAELPPRYSTDLDTAWEVVEKLIARRCGFSLAYGHSDHQWHVHLVTRSSMDAVSAPTPALAICRAALEFLEHTS